jgi:hypothetical protein
MGGSNFAVGTFTIVAVAVACWIATVTNAGETRMWVFGLLAVGFTALAVFLLRRATPDDGPPV